MSQHIKWTMLKDKLGFHIYQEPLTDESYPVCVVGTHAPNPEKSALLITAAPYLLAALKAFTEKVGKLAEQSDDPYKAEAYMLFREEAKIALTAIRRAEEGA